MAQIYLSPAASMRPAVRGPAVHQGVRLQRVSVLSPPKEAAFRGIGNSVGRLRAVEQYANGSSVGEGLIPSPVSEVGAEAHWFPGNTKLGLRRECCIIYQ